MSWIEIRSKFSEDLADLSPCVECYRQFGVENTLEENFTLTGCLVDVAGSQERIGDLVAALWDVGALTVETQALAEANWEEAWKVFFKPRRVGQRFVIRPTWEQFDSKPGDLVIVLDPGQAFGTGDHPTTRMCLELLETIELTGRSVLDLGCGSGILAVGAKQLGAFTVVASDIDALAVEVAKENALRNLVELETFVGDGFSDQPVVNLNGVPQDETPLEIVPPDASRWSESKWSSSFDVVISNIISATLIRLAPDIKRVVKQPASWIVSGIIVSNWPDVRMTAEAIGWNLVDIKEEDGWVAARFDRS